ncbi:hypothetical protein D0N36_14540 [Hymenobacter lapidiphilus]|uniref:hypothetical protein n=1 Tax=Hymenobacter sp. CCM 8763 TaxID=2303334 RepID=UPI000E345625|nr:hypothetical protein [Hymenobacter sp. CCM 8763]RFP64403.1 hypothetical protein D0N36_14540 [Hymenobacter sp. CCM 8763]
MQSTNLTLACPESRTIPYRWATPGQHAQAVLWVAEQLHDHFPTLPVAAFAQAFHAFEPDLWEDGNGLWLDYADLVRLTQRVARSPLVPDLAPPIYCADAYYLADVLDYYHRAATDLLAELKDGAQIPNRRLVSLIERLAIGNSVVERVLRETKSKAVAHDALEVEPPSQL